MKKNFCQSLSPYWPPWQTWQPLQFFFKLWFQGNFPLLQCFIYYLISQGGSLASKIPGQPKGFKDRTKIFSEKIIAHLCLLGRVFIVKRRKGNCEKCNRNVWWSFSCPEVLVSALGPCIFCMNPLIRQIPIDGSIGLNWRNWIVQDPHRLERAAPTLSKEENPLEQQ